MECFLHDACACGWRFQSLRIARGGEEIGYVGGEWRGKVGNGVCGLGIVERWLVRLSATNFIGFVHFVLLLWCPY